MNPRCRSACNLKICCCELPRCCSESNMVVEYSNYPQHHCLIQQNSADPQSSRFNPKFSKCSRIMGDCCYNRPSRYSEVHEQLVSFSHSCPFCLERANSSRVQKSVTSLNQSSPPILSCSCSKYSSRVLSKKSEGSTVKISSGSGKFHVVEVGAFDNADHQMIVQDTHDEFDNAISFTADISVGYDVDTCLSGYESNGVEKGKINTETEFPASEFCSLELDDYSLDMYSSFTNATTHLSHNALDPLETAVLFPETVDPKGMDIVNLANWAIGKELITGDVYVGCVDCNHVNVLKISSKSADDISETVELAVDEIEVNSAFMVEPAGLLVVNAVKLADSTHKTTKSGDFDHKTAEFADLVHKTDDMPEISELVVSLSTGDMSHMKDVVLNDMLAPAPAENSPFSGSFCANDILDRETQVEFVKPAMSLETAEVSESDVISGIPVNSEKSVVHAMLETRTPAHLRPSCQDQNELAEVAVSTGSAGAVSKPAETKDVKTAVNETHSIGISENATAKIAEIRSDEIVDDVPESSPCFQPKIAILDAESEPECEEVTDLESGGDEFEVNSYSTSEISSVDQEPGMWKDISDELSIFEDILQEVVSLAIKHQCSLDDAKNLFFGPEMYFDGMIWDEMMTESIAKIELDCPNNAVDSKKAIEKEDQAIRKMPNQDEGSLKAPSSTSADVRQLQAELEARLKASHKEEPPDLA